MPVVSIHSRRFSLENDIFIRRVTKCVARDNRFSVAFVFIAEFISRVIIRRRPRRGGRTIFVECVRRRKAVRHFSAGDFPSFGDRPLSILIFQLSAVFPAALNKTRRKITHSVLRAARSPPRFRSASFAYAKSRALAGEKRRARVCLRVGDLCATLASFNNASEHRRTPGVTSLKRTQSAATLTDGGPLSSSSSSCHARRGILTSRIVAARCAVSLAAAAGQQLLHSHSVLRIRG